MRFSLDIPFWLCFISIIFTIVLFHINSFADTYLCEHVIFVQHCWQKSLSICSRRLKMEF